MIKVYVVGGWFPPLWTGADAVAFCSRVFVRKAKWDSLLDAHKKSLLVHESVHLKQMGEHPVAWLFLYWVSPSFRLEVEVEAYVESIRYLLSQDVYSNLEVLIHAFAEVLSEGIYGNVKYEAAVNLLKRGLCNGNNKS